MFCHETYSSIVVIRLMIKFSNLFLPAVFLCSFGCVYPQKEKIKLIIDADTANEVDDLFALTGAIANPSFDLLGITSAQFHTSPLASDSTVRESQLINEKLTELMERTDIPLPLGANMPLDAVDQPKSSSASTFIIDQANKIAVGDSLILVILGSCTNVASAILEDPGIIPKIRVHYLGFWHDPKTNVYDKKEFNSGNDTLAINFLLNLPDLDFTVMSATTSQNLVFEKSKVEKELADLGELGVYLLQRWENFDRWWTTEDPNKEKWTMWDVAIIESLAHPELTKLETFMTPPENKSRQIRIYTEIEEGEMESRYWKTLSGGIKSN